MAERRLGGHSLKLHRPYARSVARSNFFLVRVVETWNNLPDDVFQTLWHYLKKMSRSYSFETIGLFNCLSVYLFYNTAAVTVD